MKEGIALSICFWLQRRQRLLWGGEALSAQGLSWAVLKPKARELLDQRRLMDLSGNAFSGYCIAPLLTVAISLFPWGASIDAVDIDAVDESGGCSGSGPESIFILSDGGQNELEQDGPLSEHSDATTLSMGL